jgi:hypothetical protein
LWREAAFGGGVDDEDYFAGVLRERVGCTFLWGGGAAKLVEEHRGRERTWWDVLSLGVKSKKEVAEAMVRCCWWDGRGEVEIWSLSPQMLRNGRDFAMPVAAGWPLSLMPVWKRERDACIYEEDRMLDCEG